MDKIITFSMIYPGIAISHLVELNMALLLLLANDLGSDMCHFCAEHLLVCVQSSRVLFSLCHMAGNVPDAGHFR